MSTLQTHLAICIHYLYNTLQPTSLHVDEEASIFLSFLSFITLTSHSCVRLDSSESKHLRIVSSSMRD